MNDPLLEDYARRHPAEVAARLAHHEAAECVELLRELSPEVAAQLLPILPGSQLLRVVDALRAAELVAWLDAAGFDLSVAVLLRLGSIHRAALLEIWPDRRNRLELEHRFAWPEGVLGALASRHIVTVPAGALLADVVAELQRYEGDAEDEPGIYVLDAGGVLRGEVDLRRALEAPDRSVPVLRCLQRIDGLAADTPLTAALDAPAWRRLGRLPVVDRSSRLVGSVTLAQLRDATRSLDAEAEAFETVTQLATSFLDVLSGLAGLAFGGGPDADTRGKRPS